MSGWGPNPGHKNMKLESYLNPDRASGWYQKSRLGFRVQGLGFRVQGLGFRVQGLGFGIMCHTKFWDSTEVSPCSKYSKKTGLRPNYQ